MTQGTNTYVRVPATKVLVGRNGFSVTKLLLCIGRVGDLVHFATATPRQRQRTDIAHRLLTS